MAPEREEDRDGVAVIQEFSLEGDDRTTANYDRVQEALDTRGNPPAGGLVHTAGFDEQAGVFRFFDVWGSAEAWETFLNDRLMPNVQPMMEQGGRPPETRVYPLVDFMVSARNTPRDGEFAWASVRNDPERGHRPVGRHRAT